MTDKNLKDVNKKLKELKEVFMEMSPVKSEFDILNFTLAKEGPFIAHQYHFIIKQYSVAYSELKRLFLDKLEEERNLEKLKNKFKKEENDDINVFRSQMKIENLEFEIQWQKYKIDRYEFIRKKLEKENWWKITYAQYNAEEPWYWEWNLNNQARQELLQRQTWLSKWVVNAFDMASRENNILPDYKIDHIIDENWKLNIEKIIEKSKALKNDCKASLKFNPKFREIKDKKETLFLENK